MLCKQELSDVTCVLEVAAVRCNDPYFTPPPLPTGGHLMLIRSCLSLSTSTRVQTYVLYILIPHILVALLQVVRGY